MKTETPKGKEITRDWYLFDAKGKILGRLATQIASLLMGKAKTNFAFHLDLGDFVVVTNAEKIRVTGNKMKQKVYYHHTGFPGGIKNEGLKQLLARKPAQVLVNAVSGMLPKNKLRKNRLTRLKVFSGGEHPFQDKKLIEVN